MAKINNQEVMQKLIDELKLYPGKDIIPTELAEKILPVFNVNSQEISVKNPTADIVRNAQVDNSPTSATIYTTPATGKFYLTGVSLSTNVSAAYGSTGGQAYVQVAIDGATQRILVHTLASSTGNVSAQASALSLQNPVLLDQSAAITLAGGNTGVEAVASIVGYTES